MAICGFKIVIIAFNDYDDDRDDENIVIIITVPSPQHLMFLRENVFSTLFSLFQS